MMEQDLGSFGTTILIAVVASAIGGALSGVFLWWRQSAVQQAKNDARDAAHTAELQHFRTETDKMFGKMETLMNGFGKRLEDCTEQQGKHAYTLFGVDGSNGLRGDMKELQRGFAAVVTRLSGVEGTTKELVHDVAQHDQQLQGRGRTDRL